MGSQMTRQVAFPVIVPSVGKEVVVPVNVGFAERELSQPPLNGSLRTLLPGDKVSVLVGAGTDPHNADTLSLRHGIHAEAIPLPVHPFAQVGVVIGGWQEPVTVSRKFKIRDNGIRDPHLITDFQLINDFLLMRQNPGRQFGDCGNNGGVPFLRVSWIEIELDAGICDEFFGECGIDAQERLRDRLKILG
jgi:hypothetical protein